MAEDTTTDPELVRLLDDHGRRMHNLGETDDSAAPYGLSRWDWTRRAEWSHAALLDYIAARYVRRDAAGDPPIVTPAVPSRAVTVRIVGRERVVSAKYPEGLIDGR